VTERAPVVGAEQETRRTRRLVTTVCAERIQALAWLGDDILVGDCVGSLARVSRSGAVAACASALDGTLLTASIAPDGRRVAVAGLAEEPAAIVLLEEPPTVRRLALGLSNLVDHVSFSPDGGLLAIASARRLVVVDERDETVFESDAHPGAIAALSWSPQGRLLGVASRGCVRVWDLEERKSAGTFEHGAPSVSLAWSPRGDVLACGTMTKALWMLRVDLGESVWLPGFQAPPRVLGFSPDGGLLAASGSKDVVLCPLVADYGPEPILLRFHGALVTAVAFAPSGTPRLASAARDGSVAVFAPEDLPRPSSVFQLDEAPTAMAWDSAGRQLAMAAAKSLHRASIGPRQSRARTA
jgi:WD40 repeat protein